MSDNTAQPSPNQSFSGSSFAPKSIYLQKDERGEAWSNRAVESDISESEKDNEEMRQESNILEIN